jgi:hypothetical protein
MAATTAVSQSFDKAGNKISDVITTIIMLIVVVVVVVIIYKLYKGAKAAAGAVGDTIGDAILAKSAGIPVQRVQVCREVANDLHSNIGGWPLYNVDEDAWIISLNRLNKVVEVKIVSRFFKELRTDGLKSWIDKSFSDGEKQRLKQGIITNIY